MPEETSSRDEILGEIGERIIEIFRFIQREVTIPREGFTPVTRSEADIMRVVMERPGTTVSEIARTFGQQKSNTSTRIASLVEKGLVRKATAPGDGREVHVYPTDRAQVNLDELRRVWAAQLSPLTGASDAELLRTSAILIEFAEGLAAARPDESGATPSDQANENTPVTSSSVIERRNASSASERS